MSDDPNHNRLVLKLFGCLVMAVGGIITFLCGLCTVAYEFSTGEYSPHGASDHGWVLMIGGVPTLIGAGLAYLGYRLFRAGRTKRTK